MSCNHPLYAIDLGIKENGKRNIKILPRRVDISSMKQLEARYGHGSIIPLPCGKCIGCKLSKAREWSVRCTLEASCYSENSFVTLTYDDDHLPEDGLLHREHLTKFIKRLRKKLKFPIRYFACGEYGSKGVTLRTPFGRPHFHLIIFGYFPKDWNLGSSREISEVWPFGFNTVDDCNFRTCNYVARYTVKKIFKEGAGKEFISMSLKPGIGYPWLVKHFDIFDDDAIYGNFGSGKVSNIPRYFQKVMELVDPEKLSEVKDQRIAKAMDLKLHELIQHSMTEVEYLYKYKDDIQVADYKRRGDRKDL